MKTQNLTIGQRVKHPKDGLGTVKSINEQTADIRFDDATRTVDPVTWRLSPAEPSVAVTGPQVPLKQFVESSIETLLTRMGYENPDAVIAGLGAGAPRQTSSAPG